jgi:hypothetical protein
LEKSLCDELLGWDVKEEKELGHAIANKQPVSSFQDR